jgi:hypothetical protein
MVIFLANQIKHVESSDWEILLLPMSTEESFCA